MQFRVDWVSIAQMVLFTVATCPPNLLWQQYLESRFPATIPNGFGDRGFQTGNTAIKLVLDQSVGAMTNTAFFIVGMGLLKGKASGEIGLEMHKVTADRHKRCRRRLIVHRTFGPCYEVDGTSGHR